MENSTNGLHLNDDNSAHHEEVNGNDTNNSTELDGLLDEFRTRGNVSEVPNEKTLLQQDLEPQPELISLDDEREDFLLDVAVALETTRSVEPEPICIALEVAALQATPLTETLVEEVYAGNESEKII